VDISSATEFFQDPLFHGWFVSNEPDNDVAGIVGQLTEEFELVIMFRQVRGSARDWRNLHLALWRFL
jgi:hypothetical protein